MKILIVDDEALVRRSLSRALSKKHEVIEASDGTEGLAMWRKNRPDLIFLDVLMPGLSGPEVLKEMGHERTGRVILMSAFAGEHNMETALEMGADLFVGKPFEDIFAVVQLAEGLLA